MCSRGSSQIIKIVLVMLISGILLSEEHPKRYQLVSGSVVGVLGNNPRKNRAQA